MMRWTWSDDAKQVIERFAASDRVFMPDDVLDVVGHPDEGHSANGRNNAIGSLFAHYHAAGLIEPVGIAKSRQPHRKGGMVRTWRGTAKAVSPPPRLWD